MSDSLERDMRIFNGFMERGVGPARTRYLISRVLDKAPTLPGDPGSAQWFQAWALVLQEEGTTADLTAAASGLRNVKKLRDSIG